MEAWEESPDHGPVEAEDSLRSEPPKHFVMLSNSKTKRSNHWILIGQIQAEGGCQYQIKTNDMVCQACFGGLLELHRTSLWPTPQPGTLRYRRIIGPVQGAYGMMANIGVPQEEQSGCMCTQFQQGM